MRHLQHRSGMTPQGVGEGGVAARSLVGNCRCRADPQDVARRKVVSRRRRLVVEVVRGQYRISKAACAITDRQKAGTQVATTAFVLLLLAVGGRPAHRWKLVSSVLWKIPRYRLNTSIGTKKKSDQQPDLGSASVRQFVFAGADTVSCCKVRDCNPG